MPKNKIQFQKGLSLHRFHQLYGREEQCRNILFDYHWPHGYSCPKCGHNHYFRIASRVLYQCASCRFQSSLTSGSIFASTKLPLTIWFLAIYLMTQSNDRISSLNLARSLGISANAALRIKHKLQQIMKEEDDSFPLHGHVQLDDAYWGGQRHDGWPGRGASGKTPFLAAVSVNVEGHPIAMRLSRVARFSAAEIGHWCHKHLGRRSTIVSDGLLGFRGVGKAGFEHAVIVTGGGHKSMAIKELNWINTMLGNVKRSLHGTYHALSQKHIPRYLAEFCYRFNRRFRMDLMVPSLARAAINFRPIPQHQLKLAEDWW